MPAFLSGPAVTESEKWAALSLFIAENLDRTHRSMVSALKLEKKGQSLSLDVTLLAPAPLEEASVDKIRKHTKRLLGEAIDIRFHIEDREVEIVRL